MKKVRIGNDISVTWSIKDNGTPINMTDYDASVRLYDAYMNECKSTWRVGPDNVYLYFSAVDQDRLGVYTIVLELKDKVTGGVYTIDSGNAFELVLRTEMAGGSDSDEVKVVSHELSSDLSVVVPGLKGVNVEEHLVFEKGFASKGDVIVDDIVIDTRRVETIDLSPEVTLDGFVPSERHVPSTKAMAKYVGKYIETHGTSGGGGASGGGGFREIKVGDESIYAELTPVVKLSARDKSKDHLSVDIENNGVVIGLTDKAVENLGRAANSLQKTGDTATGLIIFESGLQIGTEKVTVVDTSKDGLNANNDNSLPTSKAVVRYVDDSTLSSKTEDTAKGTITFENGLKVGNYAPGVADGTGGAMEVSEEGVVTTTDYLNVRRKARFNEVEILTTHHIGGAQMSSAASCKIDHVVTRVDGVYQCFFRKTDADGRTITNDWKKGDQAYCNTFNLQEQADGTKGNHYFWRLVVSTDAVTGTLTSDLGETFNADEYHCVWMAMAMNNCAEGSDAPIAGDEVVLLGHQPQSGEIEADCAGRQSAIYQVASGTDGRPYYRQYVGINSFSLEGCLEQQLMPNDNILSGKLVIKEGSTGWENFEGLNETLDGALNGIQDTNSRVDNLSFSNTNLLRNSGFYGDTKSKAILGDTMMSTDTELYSPSLEYWAVSNAVAYPSDANEEGAETTPTITDSKSGYYCKLNNGYISQIIGTALVDEDYIISFRGKGNVTIGFVGNMETVTLSDTSTRHIIRCKARTTTVNAILRIEGTGSICEIMLERGNIPSNTWNRSTLDASKELSRFHNLEYLTQAIQEGSTTMMGGLILSNILMLGNYVDGIMKQVTSGISGTYNQGDDVSYWAGGSLENAIYTATKLLKNPFYQFTEAEKKNLANAIITHGGTAIFNEAIVRGIVYATNGIFTGEVNATSGTFNNVVINENAIIKGKFNKVSQHITQENFYDFFYSNKETVYDDTNADIAEALPTRLLSWGDIIYIDSVDQTLLGASGNSFIVFPALLPFIDNKGILRHRKIYGYHKQNGEDVRLTAENVRELINREFLIINNSNANIQITSVLAKFPCEQESPTGTRTIDPYVEQIRGAESQIISQAQYVINYIDSNNNPFGFSLNPGGALWLKYVVSETRVDESDDLYAESIALVGLQLHCSTTEEDLEEDLNT